MSELGCPPPAAPIWEIICPYCKEVVATGIARLYSEEYCEYGNIIGKKIFEQNKKA